MFLAFQYIISDYGSVIMLVLNGDALISNKSYKEIAGNRKLICPNFHMESKKKKRMWIVTGKIQKRPWSPVLNSDRRYRCTGVSWRSNS